MYRDFIVKKNSGTYAETLETFGLANLVSEILKRNNVPDKVIIEDKDTYYLVSSNKDITEEMLSEIQYFQIIKFIFKDGNQQPPIGVIDYYDYPKQKAIIDNYKKRYKEIEQMNLEQGKLARKLLNEEKNNEFGQKIDAEFDVYREIQGNINYPNFSTIYMSLYTKRDKFIEVLLPILEQYSCSNKNKDIVKKEITPIQIYNPNQGKGTNKIKSNGFDLSKGTIRSSWITEVMKISGSLLMMTCQYVKVGTGYDMKVFVPEFNQIAISEAKHLLFDFKRNIKSVSPIKLDILNIIDLSIKFIQRTPEYNKGKLRNTIKGFHSVYQKDLGQNKAVANISFIATPDFIEYSSKQEGREWIEILEQQRSIIQNIKELGDSIQGLNYYRNFLGSLNSAALINFNKFSYWYAGYLMQQLTKGNRFIRAFKTDTLTKFYINMEPNLTEIIQNDGFKAVASAIRKSTVSLQYTPKEKRQFDIRYGIAQQLQNKSKSKEDLTTFIGEFISTYNAETGRYAEKNNGKAVRANVKDSELIQFYGLLDSNPSRLIGALLASYGFALGKREVDTDKILRIQEEAAKLGYELTKIEDQIPVLENDSNDDEEDNIDND